MLRSRKPPALNPISECPSPAAIAKKFSAVDVQGTRSSPPNPAEVDVWEVRPGGMLVQKRDPDSDHAVVAPPLPIRVRVKYGAAYHEIRISPQASFGELKKLLSAETGLHPEGQKLLFKDRERESAAFLDMSGVRDRSKIVLVEDPSGQARKSLELRKSAKMENAARTVHQISRDVDKLAGQVSTLESLVSKGKKVADNDIVALIEQLMNQILRLDAVTAVGETKMQRRIQVKRVQKYVETLDVLKVKNVQIVSNQLQQQKPSQPQTVVTTNWEPFDLLSSAPSASAIPPSAPRSAAAVSAPPPSPPVKFNWELF